MTIIGFVIGGRLLLVVGVGDIVLEVIGCQNVKMLYSNLDVFSDVIGDTSRERSSQSRKSLRSETEALRQDLGLR